MFASLAGESHRPFITATNQNGDWFSEALPFSLEPRAGVGLGRRLADKQISGVVADSQRQHDVLQ